MTTVKTIAPAKGDLVIGHRVIAFFGGQLPCVPGEIVDVSPTGHRVTMQINDVLKMFGLPKRSVWTWRRSVGAYQDINAPTRRGCGLALAKATK